MKHTIRLDPCITPEILRLVMRHKPLPELLQRVGLVAHAKDGKPTVEALAIEHMHGHPSLPYDVLTVLTRDKMALMHAEQRINTEFAWHIIAMLLDTSKYPKE